MVGAQFPLYWRAGAPQQCLPSRPLSLPLTVGLCYGLYADVSSIPMAHTNAGLGRGPPLRAERCRRRPAASNLVDDAEYCRRHFDLQVLELLPFRWQGRAFRNQALPNL